MKLVEALQLLNRRSKDADRIACTLACGFTPLHLKTFLAAHLAQRTLQGRIDVEVGLYGDLPGTLQRLIQHPPDQVAVVVEWSDLDARLGLRGTHGWQASKVDDLAASVRARCEQLRELLIELSARTTVALALPTLPLPPMFKAPRSQADLVALELRRRVAEFATDLSSQSNVRIVDAQRLDEVSPIAARYDLTADLKTGFPYQADHAVCLASMLAGLLKPAPALKGLITDLDNTVWCGIVGEDGINQVSWDLDHKSQAHAIYQAFLGSLSDLGVLIGVASKNDPQVVQSALQRDDLIVPTNQLFPIEAHWGAKSESVRRILKAWNVGADSVVFVDDSPIELAEVEAGIPGIHCRRFPTGDDTAILNLIGELRDLFGKSTVSAEDQLRVSSLRSATALQAANSDPEEFLRDAAAEITLEWNQPDDRCFELINKTNQFNLNGRRLDDAEWRRRLADPRVFVLAVKYSDKYAPLGKISVLSGRHTAQGPVIDVWVLSCRAFSRRIEHQVLQACFERFNASQLHFDFVSTERNGPTRELLAQLTAEEPSLPTVLTRSNFELLCPSLYAKVLSHDSLLGDRSAA